MTGAKECLVGREEMLGLLVAHRDAHRQGEEVRIVLGVDPDVGRVGATVALAHGPGDEIDLEVGARGEGLDDVQVDVFSKGAAVVVGEAEGSHRSSLRISAAEPARLGTDKGPEMNRNDTRSSKVSRENSRRRSSD